MHKPQWQKFWTRNFGLFRYYVYLESNLLDFYKKNFGKAFTYGLTVPDGKLVAYYHDRKELADMMQRMYDVSCKDFTTFQKYSKQVLGWMKEFIDFNNQLEPKKLASYSPAQFLELYQTWYKKYLYWQTGIYFFFTLEPIVTEKFMASLDSYLRSRANIGELQKYTDAIMAPEEKNAVILEHLSALKTALLIARFPGKKSSAIKRHYQNFLWIPCYDIKDEAYDLNHFTSEIEKLMVPGRDGSGPIPTKAEKLREEIKTIQNDFRKRKTNFRRVVTSIRDRKAKELAKIMHSLVYYKDYRDDLRRVTGHAGKRFMHELARRLSLTLEETNFLTPPEVLQWLKNGKKINRKIIHGRIPSNYVLQATTAGIKLFEKHDVQRIIKHELQADSAEEKNIVKGVIGCKGYAKGFVRIVRHTVALKRVNQGDILVAVTTHPDYVPAMKKAGAIVTDEGGITSHAAIVSRELNKPCIVAAKVATQMLKDGDMVEVDANNGTIKKID